MNLEKVKRKIAEGYPDESIANMSGMSVEEIAKLRAPAPKPVEKKAPARKPAVRKDNITKK
jgi:hypothetical protein